MARQHTAIPSGYTVLVVDDQDGPLESTRAVLAREGHTVRIALSGRAGLTVLQEHRVHLVIVDYRMPEMDGPAFVRAVRRLDPYVQIILQTGNAGDTPPVTLLKELDIQGFHHKGDGPDGLLLWVASALKSHGLISRLLAADLQSHLVTQVSHHFRTPLAVILAATESLDRYGERMTPDQQKERFRKITTAVAQLTGLLDDVLATAAPGDIAPESHPEPIHLRGFCEDLAGEIRATEGAAHSLEVSVDVSRPVVEVDRKRLASALRPVLVNAVRYSPLGSTIAISIGGDATQVEVRVCNQGVGIPLEDQPRIFQEFYRGGNVGAVAGPGLGLAIARRALGALGGTISCESSAAHQTTFLLSFPSGTRRPMAA